MKDQQADRAREIREWMEGGRQIQRAINKTIAAEKKENRRGRRAGSKEIPGLRHCCACRIALVKPEQFQELSWLPRRGKYRPAICFRDLNRLLMRELAPGLSTKHARGLGASGHSGETGHGIRRSSARASG